jgi:hypothetical protein
MSTPNAITLIAATGCSAVLNADNWTYRILSAKGNTILKKVFWWDPGDATTYLQNPPFIPVPLPIPPPSIYIFDENGYNPTFTDFQYTFLSLLQRSVNS